MRPCAKAATRGSMLLLASALAACGGGGKSTTPPPAGSQGGSTPTGPTTPGPSNPAPPTTPPPGTPPPTPEPPGPVTPTPVPPAGTPKVANVEVAQTHVIPPDGRSLQAPVDKTNNEVRLLRLVAGRPALLMIQPQGQPAALQVRARLASGRTLGPLSLKPPAQLPATDDDAQPAYSNSKYSLIMPADWVQRGTTLELSQDNFASAALDIPLTAEPGANVNLYTIPIYLWGARPAESEVKDFRLSSIDTNGYRLDYEYQEKLPFAHVNQIIGAGMILDQMVVPPRNDDEFCYPAMPLANREQAAQIDLDVAGMLYGRVSDLSSKTAADDDRFQSIYYGYIQYKHANGEQKPDIWTAWGGGNVAISSSDWNPTNLFSAVFNHEVGHAYGLPHADSAASDGSYPYPFGRKSGSSWGYDANRNELLTTRQITGRTCNSNQLVDNICYQGTPLSGGDNDRMAGKYRWTTFADYQAAQIQDWAMSKYQPDSTANGGYALWDRTRQTSTGMSAYHALRLASTVLKRGQDVYTVMGTISHYNLAPAATRLYVSGQWKNNLPRHFDPTVQADMDLMKDSSTPGGSAGHYCMDTGCDYTLVVTYADNTVLRVLLPVGYRTGAGGMREDPQARDALNERNFQAYAVNIPGGRQGVTKLELFSTPFGTLGHADRSAIEAGKLGSSAYPLVTRWTTGDGATGGSGAPGNLSVDQSQCKPGAKYFPGRV